MRKSIYSGLLLSAMVVAMTGCDDNAWNDKLDGFDGDEPITVEKTIEYTLTAADYAAIASNSTNKALAGDVDAAALAAVGTQHCFTEAAPASKYAPAFLASSGFPYFTLSDGSSIKLTYNVAAALPAEVAALSAADQYVISDVEYQRAWDSDENYIEAYTPAVPPTRNIPKALADVFDDAESGTYVIVNYNYSDVEPIFGGVGGGDEPEQFAMSNVIGELTLGASVDINGVVTAKSTNGMIITDLGGSVFMYYGSSFVYDDYQIGDQLVINASVGSYNKGFQLTGSSATVEKVGTQAYTYPAPVVLDGAALDAAITRTDDAIAQYAQITGTVAVNGNNINIIVAGAETAQGGAYYAPDDFKAKLQDGANVTMTGYFIAIAGKRYCNFVVTDVKEASAAAKAPVVPVATTNTNAVYVYNGSAWSVVSGVTVLQPADYVKMGQTYGNLSKEQPAQFLPNYLAEKFPYAQADDEQYVLYKYYDGSATAYKCDQYKCDGLTWTLNNGIATETAQFVRNKGVWNFDPSVTLTLPAGRGQALSTTYYQACVDWVYENIDKPLGSTGLKDGHFYVTSYGNNEYYSGSSAYQGNVDLRAAKALEQYPAGYEGMTDEHIVELMKQRFAYQVLPGALKTLHSDAVPVEGIDVIYTINFGVYTGANATYTIRYKVTAPATFELIDCDWWEGGLPTENLLRD